ncbi:MAG TPA: glycoside hydrolase family 16 protein [Pseudonocardia sp.]
MPTPDDDQDAVLDRSAFVLEFDEDFRGGALDPGRWVDHYLPQWTTPDRSAARYDLEPGLLRLRIDADQPAWRVEDGELRVSNLQTGTLSGPLGSPVGADRHAPDVVVRTPQPTWALYTPSSGLAEAVLRAHPDPTCMLAFWLVGFDGVPERSGELCVCELFGDRIGRERSAVNIGVKAQQDPRLHDDVEFADLPIDAYDWHTYSVAWTPERARFYVDDRLVRTVEQRLDYPMLLLVDLFEFPAGPDRDPAAYPKTGDVAAIRGYRAA